MKIVLQHRTTRLYLTPDDQWAADPGEARDFGTSLKALDFVRRLEMNETEIVLKFSDPKYDIVLHTPGNKAVQSRGQERL